MNADDLNRVFTLRKRVAVLLPDKNRLKLINETPEVVLWHSEQMRRNDKLPGTVAVMLISKLDTQHNERQPFINALREQDILPILNDNFAEINRRLATFWELGPRSASPAPKLIESYQDSSQSESKQKEPSPQPAVVSSTNNGSEAEKFRLKNYLGQTGQPQNKPDLPKTSPVKGPAGPETQSNGHKSAREWILAYLQESNAPLGEGSGSELARAVIRHAAKSGISLQFGTIQTQVSKERLKLTGQKRTKQEELPPKEKISTKPMGNPKGHKPVKDWVSEYLSFAKIPLSEGSGPQLAKLVVQFAARQGATLNLGTVQACVSTERIKARAETDRQSLVTTHARGQSAKLKATNGSSGRGDTEVLNDLEGLLGNGNGKHKHNSKSESPLMSNFLFKLAQSNEAQLDREVKIIAARRKIAGTLETLIEEVKELEALSIPILV